MSAHSFPDPHIVSQNASKSLEKQAKQPFAGAQMVTVPSVCVCHGTGEAVGSSAETLKNHWKMKGSARVLASFLPHVNIKHKHKHKHTHKHKHKHKYKHNHKH